jgi:hypothetical protein
MRKFGLTLLGLVFAIVVGACSDVPAPSSKGTAVGAESQEVDEAKPPPEIEEGVIPDLMEVTLGDSREALADAGFENVRAETASVFGTVGDELLVCEQEPAAGESPPPKTQILLSVDRVCTVSSSQ